MKIQKLNYSRSPWRLVTSEGVEVYASQPFDHPSLGMTVHNGPVCGETKTECTQKALALLEIVLRKTGGEQHDRKI